MKSTVLAATAVLPAAVFLAGGVGAEPGNNEEPAPAAGFAEAPPLPPEDAPPPPPEDLPPPPPEDGPPPPPEDVPPPAWDAGPPDAFAAGSWSIPAPHALPPGIVNERGMQVKTILVARSISEAFPQINNMIGVRPDGQRWHPSGLAIDVMIPNPGSAEGIALGDQIVAYVRQNAGRFAMQDAIWRGTYYTPGGPSGRGNGHYDHVHITTFGGGYPNGSEEYLREDVQPPPA
ncbi:hypothetical protein [[Mycobacterium] nativiensis]|uniref:ARB-07466-like C-terminal domain-containing protein n=1 Tax=[Mycobacterium] nativiensis TaxID=2855503 RepID=A0ABU5XY14_9MYCO|nr:hypothetical protein [Mycolicibacter sp. MYC340]MEB3032808.1 hypothetical protein [Mycolicibacter sp. MYC340]